ncbi:MAG: VWA domain-containing protein [Planctomycetota bacterium]|nr:MAG: VWA domain-containing protein [Planctomycetota bacterium]
MKGACLARGMTWPPQTGLVVVSSLFPRPSRLLRTAMSFTHISLLAGMAVVTLPILLHLFGQRQPQTVEFPALRFVRQTAVEQSTSWQLRHFLLLLFRILLLGLLALALAQPRVHNALHGSLMGSAGVALLAALLTLAAAVAYAGRRPRAIWATCLVVAVALWGVAGWWTYASLTSGPKLPASDQSAPVAVAILVDHSPAMGYVYQNKSRFDAAKEMATWILDQLPVDSRVGVFSGAPVRSLALDPAAAKSQVQRAELSGRSIDLAGRLRAALELVAQDELERKEVYVITDLDRRPWVSAPPGLREAVERFGNQVLIQVVDVGGPREANWRLSDLQLDAEAVPSGSDVGIQVTVHRPERPPAGNIATVELLQEALDPRLPIVRNGQLETARQTVVDRQVVDLNDKDSAGIRLQAVNLAPGTHHFTVRMDQSDPLEIDNQRFASVVAYEQDPTLIVSDDPEIGRMLQLIVDPRVGTAEPGGQRSTAVIRYAQLSSAELDDYGVLCLYDPPLLAQADVEKVRQRVSAGGGLLLLLGPRLGVPQQVQGSAIESLLPGRLVDQAKYQTIQFLDPAAPTHPLFHVFGATVRDIPWGQFPVFRNWVLADLRDSAQTVLRLSDGTTPLIVEHGLGGGQVVTVTSLVPQADTGRDALWNGLWATDDPWVAFGLLLGAIRSLSGADEDVVNWQVGASVTLRNDTRVYPARWQLFLPDGQTRRVDTTDGMLLLGSFERPGTYRLRGIRGDPVARGFSVNAPAEDTVLEPIGADELAELLGPNSFRLARDRMELESSIGQARYGSELYSLVMLLVAAMFLAEQAMSNRFYQIKFRRYQGT